MTDQVFALLLAITGVSLVGWCVAIAESTSAARTAQQALQRAVDAERIARLAEQLAMRSIRKRLIEEVEDHARRQAQLTEQVREFRGAIDAARGKRPTA